MLSPTKGFVEKHRLLVARVQVAAQPFNAAPLHIFNPATTAITIKKGAIMGFLQPAKALQPSITAQPEQSSTSSFTVPQHLQELYVQSSAELSSEEQLQLPQLLCTVVCFQLGPATSARSSLVQHDIITQPSAPVKQPLRRMAWEKQQNVDRQINQSLEDGLACRSHSSWAS